MLNKFLKFIILFIFPISLFAQYPDSGNKLRLGFQTTADGLIWRDSSNTARYPTPTSNKNTYVVLDTLTNKIYHYKNSTWTLVGGDTTSLSNRIDALGEYVDSIAVNFQDSIDAIQNGYFKQEFPTVTSDTLLWTKNVQLPLYSDDLLVFRNGQFLNNTQYTRIDTNKIKIAATSYKIGNNYTIVYLRGGGAGNGNQFDSTILNLQPRLDLKLNISDTASMLTNYYRSGRALGTPSSGVLTFAMGLPISTGLTGLGAANRIPFASSATALTTTNKFTFDPSGNKLIIGKNDTLDSNPNFTINLSGSGSPSPVLGFRLYNTTLDKISAFRYDNNGSFIFSNNDADIGYGAHRFVIGSGSGEEILTVTRSSPGNGKVGVNQSNPTQALHVVGNGLFTGSITANSLSLTTPLSVANGGTGATTFTSGRVLLGNGTSAINTSSNLFYDVTNNRLGIGATPSYLLDLRNNINGQNTMQLTNTSTGTAALHGIFCSQDVSINERWGGFFYTNDGYTGAVGTASTFFMESAGSGGLYIGTRGASGYIRFASGDRVERMRLNDAGELGIGYGATDNGAYKLQVNSQIFATNATIETSDIRFKENIQPLDKGLEIINKLKPVKFNFITTTENNFSEFDEIGFIAQDVEGALSTELFAKAVVKKLDEDKDDSALGLMTEKLIPILVKAIQEQNLLIKTLEQRIINLENK